MINDRVEDVFRELLDHALHDRLDDVKREMLDAGEQVYQQVLVLCVQVSAYITIDVSKRLPTEVDYREIAKIGSESRTNLPITEDEMYIFLSQVVFGFKRLDEMFTDEKRASIVPLFTTANLVLSFFHKGKHWSDYLDVIENAIEVAEQERLDVLPSLMYRHLALGAQAGEKVRPSTNQP